MSADITELDAHEQPSEAMRASWKTVSKADQDQLLGTAQIDDPRAEDQRSQYCSAGTIPADRIAGAFRKIAGGDMIKNIQDAPVYYHPILPGTKSRGGQPPAARAASS